MSRMRSDKHANGRSNTNHYHAVTCPGNGPALHWARIVGCSAPTLGLMAVFGGLLVLTLGAGCASKKAVPDASTSNLAVSDAPRASALEVAAAPVSTQAVSTPAEAPPSPAPAYEPPGPTPTPDPVITQAPTLVGGPGIAVGGPYTVQHGDTLFRIAKEHYGDGKQWKRIASANPGLTPANLKAGQSIMLP